MKYQVRLTRSTMADLDAIVQWIARNDSVKRALYVLDKIETKIGLLDQHPEGGTYPPELRALGLTKYWEVFFKPYRVIYQVRSKEVIVHLIADGHRDMSALLQRRLTG